MPTSPNQCLILYTSLSSPLWRQWLSLWPRRLSHILEPCPQQTTPFLAPVPAAVSESDPVGRLQFLHTHLQAHQQWHRQSRMEGRDSPAADEASHKHWRKVPCRARSAPPRLPFPERSLSHPPPEQYHGDYFANLYTLYLCPERRIACVGDPMGRLGLLRLRLRERQRWRIRQALGESMALMTGWSVGRRRTEWSRRLRKAARQEHCLSRRPEWDTVSINVAQLSLNNIP